MSITNLQVEADPGKVRTHNVPAPVGDFKVTFVETPSVLASAIQQIREWINEPKVTVPPQYYRGEAKLPATDMRPWFLDLPSQLKIAFEKPRDAIGLYNYEQHKKRLLCGFALAIVLGASGWFWRQDIAMLLGLIAGFALGEFVGALIFKERPYPRDIWSEYRMQAGSWLNSVLLHAVVITLLLLPYILVRLWAQPAKPPTKVIAVEISPYLPDLPQMAGKKAGGGGGGGDRSPTAASKGVVPKFAKVQLAPPMAVIPNPKPLLPVTPTLLGPPQLKLPQMSENMPWGDPNGVVGPPSNGPGTGGAIGSGEGTGIGSGKGGGLGPGEGGGTGGGYYSVGAGVSAPIPIYKPDPAYSEEARKAKYQGTVVLWITIDSAGSVTNCQIVKRLGMGLDEKAEESVQTWKFKPAMRNGSPVPVRVMVEVSFRLF